MIGEQFCILYLRCFDKFSIYHYMQVSVELIFDRLDDFWMAMTDICHTYTTNKIDIFLSIYVIEQQRTFGFYDLQG